MPSLWVIPFVLIGGMLVSASQDRVLDPFRWWRGLLLALGILSMSLGAALVVRTA